MTCVVMVVIASNSCVLTAKVRRHKNSVQMVRSIMMVLTQAWTSNQDVLFKPFNQLPQIPKFNPEFEGNKVDFH